MTFQVDSPGTVLISTLLDILALDILGLDILGRFPWGKLRYNAVVKNLSLIVEPKC